MDLLPCPHCRNPTPSYVSDWKSSRKAFVECDVCGLTGPELEGGPDISAEAWNALSRTRWIDGRFSLPEYGLHQIYLAAQFEQRSTMASWLEDSKLWLTVGGTRLNRADVLYWLNLVPEIPKI